MDDTTLTFDRNQTSVLDDVDETKEPATTPLKAARWHCLWCCNGSAKEARLCVSRSCPLWPLRFGRGPTDELKAEVADRVLS
jgi:hypothetical protein